MRPRHSTPSVAHKLAAMRPSILLHVSLTNYPQSGPGILLHLSLTKQKQCCPGIIFPSVAHKMTTVRPRHSFPSVAHKLLKLVLLIGCSQVSFPNRQLYWSSRFSIATPLLLRIPFFCHESCFINQSTSSLITDKLAKSPLFVSSFPSYFLFFCSINFFSIFIVFFFLLRIMAVLF